MKINKTRMIFSDLCLHCSGLGNLELDLNVRKENDEFDQLGTTEQLLLHTNSVRRRMIGFKYVFSLLFFFVYSIGGDQNIDSVDTLASE